MNAEDYATNDTAHTLGPWSAKEYCSPKGTWYIEGADGKMIGGGQPLGAANARLIAAAPELLGALKQISALWPMPPNCADVEGVHGINDGKARAILLKTALDISREAIQKVEVK